MGRTNQKRNKKNACLQAMLVYTMLSEDDAPRPCTMQPYLLMKNMTRVLYYRSTSHVDCHVIKGGVMDDARTSSRLFASALLARASPSTRRLRLPIA